MELYLSLAPVEAVLNRRIMVRKIQNCGPFQSMIAQALDFLDWSLQKIALCCP